MADAYSPPRTNFFPGDKPGIFHASRAPYRFIVLFFNCLLTFGSYFCYDMPSVLQVKFTSPLHPNSTRNCSSVDGVPSLFLHNGSACYSGLGLDETQFNLLYSIYAWTLKKHVLIDVLNSSSFEFVSSVSSTSTETKNAVVVIMAGFLIDKLGNAVGVLLFSGMCVIGTSVFAAGLYFKDHAGNMFAVMLIGRLLFGSGNGSLTIVQNRVSAFWFKGKELAFAFGCTLAFSRLGSVLNFFLTEDFEESHGMKWTLWGGAILCVIGFTAAIVVAFLDIRGMTQLNVKAAVDRESKKMRLTDIKFFTLQFWLLALTLMFFYNGVFPFVSDASKFIRNNYKENFKFNEKTSAYIAGAVYDVSMVFSPFMGTIVDNFGYRGVLSFLCAFLTIPVYGLLAFAPGVHPLVSTIWLGVTYSIAAAALWPSIPLVVSQATVGTAMGLTTSIQMIGIGLANLAVGKMLDKITEHKWKYVMIFLLANSLSCVVMAVLLNIVDYRRGGLLNRSTRKRKQNELKDSAKIHPKRPGRGYTEKSALLYDSNSSIN